MAPEALERLLAMLPNPSAASAITESRVLAGRARNEDAVVISVPPGKALVQSVDILTPLVNDGFMFGRIAAANALSDIYALGGQPWSAMNIACFPSCGISDEMEQTLGQILRGGMYALNEAGAVLAGGHTIVDDSLKYGLAVTGIIDPTNIATNDGLRVDDILILTKPIGTGILVTAIKAHWDAWEDSQAVLCEWCTRLNKAGGEIIQKLRLRAATDITGFGLGGHVLEMALASKVSVVLYADAVPLLPHAYEYASDGLIPAGSHANRQYCASQTLRQGSIAPALESLIFDMQTSGGLILAVPPALVNEAMDMLRIAGDRGWIVGRVAAPRMDGISLVLRPSESDAV